MEVSYDIITIKDRFFAGFSTIYGVQADFNQGIRMFRDIKIDSYRGLREATLEDLDRVNVVIGENNSGKTSVLEAIQILGQDNVLDNLVSVDKARYSSNRMRMGSSPSKYDSLLYSFPTGSSKIRIAANWNGRDVEAEVSSHTEYLNRYDLSFTRDGMDAVQYYLSDDGHVPAFAGDYSYYMQGYGELHQDFIIPAVGLLKDDEPVNLSKKDRREPPINIRYISPRDLYLGTYEIGFFKGLSMEDKEQLVRLLRIFDPSIVNVESSLVGFTKRILIENESGSIKPISVYGEGMRRAFSIANALRATRGGALLIDEFEVGIHKNALVSFVEFLCVSAKENDTQLFLTTHSGDAIDALIDVHKQGNGFNSYRLESFKNDIYVRQYAGKDLYSLRQEQGYGLL